MPHRNKLILVVEDDPNDVIFLKRAFTNAGFNNPIKVVENGEAAVQYLAGKPPYNDRAKNPFPALVFLDLKMPLKSGFEVLEWIRKSPEVKDLPVVILTSSDEPSDISRGYKMGANSYLIKPVRPYDLTELLKNLKF